MYMPNIPRIFTKRLNEEGNAIVKVMQSFPSSVRPSVFTLFLTKLPLTLTFCMCIGHDRSSQRIEVQGHGHRSRVRIRVRLMLSV